MFAFASALFGGVWWTQMRASAAGRADVEAPAPPIPSPTSPRKIDEYGDIRWPDEQARLDNVAIEARNDPTATTYFVCYGGLRSYEGEARRRCGRAARYLKTKGGIEAARVVTLDGGFREEVTVECWVLPAKTQPPSLSPTVDPIEVTIIKRGGARRPRRR